VAVVKEAFSTGGAIDARGDPTLIDFESYFTCGPVLLDRSLHIFAALGSRQLSLATLKPVLSELAWSPRKGFERLWALHQKRIDGNLRGEGLVMGGVIVMRPGEAGSAYVHHEQIGLPLPLEAIREAARSVDGERHERAADAERTAEHRSEACAAGA